MNNITQSDVTEKVGEPGRSSMTKYSVSSGVKSNTTGVLDVFLLSVFRFGGPYTTGLYSCPGRPHWSSPPLFPYSLLMTDI